MNTARAVQIVSVNTVLIIAGLLGLLAVGIFLFFAERIPPDQS
jgi:hypothetical protein